MNEPEEKKKKKKVYLSTRFKDLMWNFISLKFYFRREIYKKNANKS